MKIATSFTLLTSLVAVAFASSVADVVGGIQGISNQVTALTKAIAAFPNTGGSLSSALAMHGDIDSLVAAIDKGTADVNGVPKPLSEAASNKILTAVQKVEPVILDVLKGITAKQPAFLAIPLFGGLVSPTVQQDLKKVEASTSKLGAALTKAASADQKNKAKSIKTTVDAAFASAIDAYN
ncbi:hypothetical protein GALMADRAFT_216991 [Galerina marginata CBS 339.88]|uniref:Hydrophobic surface binding protein n=1 Tax=Galerina marginata (strain CBS 339.88) TaxID=685588 RepID=A0A067SFW0_GALM3|nr:hypothetical protein GALMADRAFT_216991 [Galerina marginata CBS 339.88]